MNLSWLWERVTGMLMFKSRADLMDLPGPVDPSGRPATGQTQHLIVEEGADPFLIRVDSKQALIWRSSDTSVARLEVAEDTRSATVWIVGQGTTTLSVTDGESCEYRKVMVLPRASATTSPLHIETKR